MVKLVQALDSQRRLSLYMLKVVQRMRSQSRRQLPFNRHQRLHSQRKPKAVHRQLSQW